VRRAALAAAALWAGCAAAQSAAPSAEPRVVAALARNLISITAGFQGSEIFVYGAIQRAPGRRDEPLGVVVKVQGPSQPVTVRRKRPVLGVWINAESARLDAAPSYYAVATTGPFFETISHTEDLRRRVSLEHALRYVGARQTVEPRENFLDAVVRLRREAGLYVVEPGGVTVDEGVLFRARFDLPANIVEGDYAAQVLLTRDRTVIDSFDTVIAVRKEGLERLIDRAAQERPLAYGLAAVALALGCALVASEAFRRMRG
jgi:uncharacterized protein (TIGR02186 family)